MCGEHRNIIACICVSLGSSPHVRGALKCGFAAVPGLRIIPACAGSTKRFSSTEMPFRDHPRMCGEHLATLLLSVTAGGSSPHVRGAPSERRKASSTRGIIPACAGSTCRANGRTGRSWDHPRMCGEHSGEPWLLSPVGGSSPHVRGARGRAPFPPRV